MKIIKNLNKDIKEFGVYIIKNGYLVLCNEIQSKSDYQHGFYDLHHFIKDSEYQRNKQWYIKHNIKQKLILMSRKMHTHLENPIYMLSDEQFLQRYHIDKSILLFNKKKWIEEQIRKEYNE